MMVLQESASKNASQTGDHVLRPEMTVADMLDSIRRGPHDARFVLYCDDIRQKLHEISTHFSPVQAAGGLVFTPSGEVLLMFRRGKWDLPKGKVDAGESIEDCAIREVAEETGVTDLTLGNHLHTTYHTYSERGQNILKDSHWFLMPAREPVLLVPQTEEDIEQCVWVPLARVHTYIPGAHASIGEVLQKGLPLVSAATGISLV